MLKPAHTITAPRMSRQRAVAIALVGLVHIAGLWALTSGLATRLVHAIPHDMEVSVIRSPQTLAQSPSVLQPKMVQPSDIPVLQPPEINIDTPPASQITATLAPSDQISDSTASGLAATHTTPPYPALARRLGQEGNVRLQLTISPQGDVVAAQVVASSGVPELDSTAVAWVMAHWKYKSAVQGGVTVPSTTQAVVVFNLKHAR